MTNQPTNATRVVVAGHLVQIDASGQGHAWRNATRDNTPADIIQEIEGEIIDGKLATGQIVATNGQHYRWLA